MPSGIYSLSTLLKSFLRKRLFQSFPFPQKSLLERKIKKFLASHAERHEVKKTPDGELLPVGRPIKGRGWRGTLLTRCFDGVAYLEVQGVIHTAPHQQVWQIEGVRFYKSSYCCRCGRPLTVPESIERGIGKECARIIGLVVPHRGGKHAPAPSK